MDAESKASIEINVAVVAKDDGGYQGEYSLKSRGKGSGRLDPNVSADGDIDIYTGTDVKFILTTEGFTFPEKQPSDPTKPAVIKIGSSDLAPGDTVGPFKVGDDQPDDQGTVLKLHDDDKDAPEDESKSTDHTYYLYVVTGGVTYELEPKFHNRN